MSNISTNTTTATTKTTAKTQKGWRPADQAKREVDENLLRQVDASKEFMRKFYEMVSPECPTCRKKNTREAGTRQSYLCGTRVIYKCENDDCPRKTFVIDDSRIRNLAIKNAALEMLYFGGKEMAATAHKIIRDYAINPGNMPLFEHTKEMTK